jgi:ABC-type nickel/cobalt efflux system permease component RcnA
MTNTVIQSLAGFLLVAFLVWLIFGGDLHGLATHRSNSDGVQKKDHSKKRRKNKTHDHHPRTDMGVLHTSRIFRGPYSRVLPSIIPGVSTVYAGKNPMKSRFYIEKIEPI